MTRHWALLLALAGLTGGQQPDQPLEVSAPVGGQQLLDCQLDFPFNHHIPYHLQWDKDGEEVYSWYSGGLDEQPVEAVGARWRGRVRRGGAAGGGGALLVGALRASDAGLYRCRVAFPNRSPPARKPPTYWRVSVIGDDLIITPPVNNTVREGDSVELPCAPYDQHADVAWSKDGDQLPATNGTVLVAANGSLLVSEARATDAGLYECAVSARGADGAQQRAAAYLDVQYPARVVYAPSERLLALGRPAALDCHFSANPPLTNLRWEKDGFLFDPYNVPGVFYSRNGSLLFNSIGEQHEGTYACTPYNALGTAGPAPPVRVRVLRAPVLRVRPRTLYVARAGDALVLPCEPQPAQPPPRVEWRRADGRPLPPRRHALSGGNLTLSPLAAGDAGDYTCNAENTAGVDTATTSVRLENAPPRAVSRLSARASPSEIHVQWAPPPQLTAAEAAAAEYSVWWRRAAAPEWRQLRVLSRGATAATLLALQPRTHYELRVLYTDRLGDALFSRPLAVRTPGEQENGVTEALSADTDTDTDTDDATTDEDEERGQVQVRLRLVEDGVLVRWTGAGAGAGAGDTCQVTVASAGRVLAELQTHQQYVLVSGGVEEGESLHARVECGGGGAGAAALTVPAYARLRAVALGCGGGALLLAAIAAAACWLRHRAT